MSRSLSTKSAGVSPRSSTRASRSMSSGEATIPMIGVMAWTSWLARKPSGTRDSTRNTAGVARPRSARRRAKRSSNARSSASSWPSCLRSAKAWAKPRRKRDRILDQRAPKGETRGLTEGVAIDQQPCTAHHERLFRQERWPGEESWVAGLGTSSYLAAGGTCPGGVCPAGDVGGTGAPA